MNPYFERAKQMPAYLSLDPKVYKLLSEVSLDPEEEILSSVKCAHQGGGFLVITTKRLRWLQRFPFKGHEWWPLDTRLEMYRHIPPMLLLGGSELFQSSGLNPRPFREFAALHQTMVEAMVWELEHVRGR